MTIYLVHGFRWPRKKIRVHVILNNIDDAAPDYVMSSGTPDALTANFRHLFPETMNALPDLQFVEQYDPTNDAANATLQPYAFVVDKVEQGHLNINVETVMGQGVSAAKWDALADLRDQIAPGEKIGWWVVYNGDAEGIRGHRQVRSGGESWKSDVCPLSLYLGGTEKLTSLQGDGEKKRMGPFRKLLGRSSAEN